MSTGAPPNGLAPLLLLPEMAAISGHVSPLVSSVRTFRAAAAEPESGPANDDELSVILRPAASERKVGICSAVYAWFMIYK